MPYANVGLSSGSFHRRLVREQRGLSDGGRQPAVLHQFARLHGRFRLPPEPLNAHQTSRRSSQMLVFHRLLSNSPPAPDPDDDDDVVLAARL